jgi:5'-3' exoribonuclease 2
MGGYGGHMGGYGGRMGGYGGRMGGFGNRGNFGGFGGFGFFPGFYGLGYGGYGWGYGGYGYPYYGGYGMGYGYPYYGYGSGYGYGYPYSGTVYADPTAGLGYSAAYVAPGAANAVTTQAGGQGRYLGIDEEPVVGAGGQRGMKVTKVYPGTAAEKSALQVGDVIHSINGYLTEQRGNLAWIIANATPNNVLQMNVRTVRDGQEHAITAQLP